MSYISRNLEPDERVLARARYHWWVNLRSLGLLNMFDHLWITDRRILHKTGILAARTQSIHLALLESKDVEQSVWGRIFGFGDLIPHGSGDMTMRFRNIADPVGISRAIGRAAADRRESVMDQRAAPEVKQGLSSSRHRRKRSSSKYPRTSRSSGNGGRA
jgi:uncharacterized membrane protein YdbT with pleckstrin-like domain